MAALRRVLGSEDHGISAGIELRSSENSPRICNSFEGCFAAAQLGHFNTYSWDVAETVGGDVEKQKQH